MKSYDSHPDVPVWLAALNGQLLTTTELDVLNFIFWCTKHGCRTSNDRIGMFTHKSHATVQRAVMKLYSMDLVAIENYGKRTRTIKAVRWPDQAAWLKYKKLQGQIENDAAHYAPHITKLDKTHPTGVSSLVDSESPFQGDSFLPGGCRPQPPARCSVGEGDRAYQIEARKHRNKLHFAGTPIRKANRLTKAKYPKAEL